MDCTQTSYRKVVGRTVWHWDFGCVMWPETNYVESRNMNEIENEDLCHECIDLYEVQNPSQRCLIMRNGKQCAGCLIAISPDLFMCSFGHRMRIAQ